MLLVVNVNVEEPEPVTVVGLKLAVTPVGRPETLKPTAPVKPFSAPTVTLEVGLLPGSPETVVGEAETEKSEMPKVTGVVWVRLPLVAVIVNG